MQKDASNITNNWQLSFLTSANTFLHFSKLLKESTGGMNWKCCWMLNDAMWELRTPVIGMLVEPQSLADGMKLMCEMESTLPAQKKENSIMVTWWAPGDNDCCEGCVQTGVEINTINTCRPRTTALSETSLPL